ncbi:hypothetical protein [Microbispora sp. NBRC 16548]|uniref:hypothetical protein n=1 Tax=Microbispora sp. NBRC 16548 TaxID=3030994 RepID=UPI00161D6839|nr:hypothetical protein [Microbispora sp. NBRC 16548]GLX04773.1 hypothetical protein Misp03_17000 [Microbispora sp. NBRC 16548]
MTAARDLEAARAQLAEEAVALDGQARRRLLLPGVADDTWGEVTGTLVPPRSRKIPNGTVPPEMTAIQVTEIPEPSEPYE